MVLGITLRARTLFRSLLMVAGLALVLAAVLSNAGPASAQEAPSEFATLTIEDEIFAPVSLGAAPDGRLIVLTDSGVALMVKNDQVLPTPVFDLRGDVNTSGSQGLQSIAFDNNFEQNGFIYVIYTRDTNGNPNDTIGRNRLVRFTMNGDVATNETLLFNNFPVGDDIVLHYGGAIEVGNDGFIYTTVGDYLLGANGQNRSNLQGTVLRLNKNGSIPGSNPFFNELNGVNRAIYAYGLRNPFQTALRPSDGEIFISDVGADRFEELNVLERGANYGWFLAEGPSDPNDPAQADFVDPLFSYRHIDTFPNDPIAGCAIVGGSFYEPNNRSFPAQYHDQYFTGDYCTGEIFVVNPNNGSAEVFADTADFGLVDMAVNPVNGDLYYIHQSFRGDETSPTGGIGKITFIGEQDAVTIIQPPSDVSIAVGGDASFFVGATAPGNITYQWLRNGSAISGETGPRLTVTNVNQSDNGDRYSVRVSSNGETVRSTDAVLRITNNTVPVPQITLTGVDAAGYEAGQSFDFAGSATDAEDGTIPPATLTWDVRLNHDDHDHELITAVGPTGSVRVPRDIETSTNVWVTLYLTATDSDGTSATVSRRVDPNVVNITLASDPGFELRLEGQARSVPYTFASVAGVRREVAAPTNQTVGGVRYTFDQWSDGAGRDEPRITPTSNTTFRAEYVENTGNACTVTAVTEGVEIDWSNEPGVEILRTDTEFVANVGAVRTFFVEVGSVGDGYRIRRDGIDEVCEVGGLVATPPPPPAGDVCMITAINGGVQVTWTDLPGVETIRLGTPADSVLLASRSRVQSYNYVGGSIGDDLFIRRWLNGQATDEICQSGGAPPPPPPPAGDVCTFTAVAGGVRVDWVDLAGSENLLRDGRWVANVRTVETRTVAGGSVDDAWVIRRWLNGQATDETCQSAGTAPPPAGDACTVAAINGGVRLTWTDRPGTETVRTGTPDDSILLAVRGNILWYDAAGGSIDDGWFIRRWENGQSTDEICQPG